MFRSSYSTTAAHTRAPSKPLLRSSRACDQCRKLRIRCVRPAGSDSCQNCCKRRFDCTADTPDHKRGPPRGYLHQLEDRLHGAEALLGVLISLPDANLQQTLSLLTRDPQAAEILSRVNHSAFGPSGRNLRTWLIDAVKNSEDGAELRKNTRLGLADDTADVMMTRKTNIWQDQLIQTISQSQSGSPPPLPINNSSLLFSFDNSVSSPTSSDFALPAFTDFNVPIAEDYPSPGSYYSSSSDSFSPQQLFGVDL